MADVFKTVNGIDVYLDAKTGQFSATVGSETIRRTSLAAVVKALEKVSVRRPVKAMQLHGVFGASELQIDGIERGKLYRNTESYYRKGKASYETYDVIYVHNAAVIDAVVVISAKRDEEADRHKAVEDALGEEFRATIKSFEGQLVRLTAENFDEYATAPVNELVPAGKD